jgi:penicillin-insensitive murein endopeptidase
MSRRLPAIALLLALVCWQANAPAGGRKLPDKYKKAPYSLMSLSVGYPNDGWQKRAIKMKTRKYLKVKGGSGRFTWGHPALVKMLYRSSRDIYRAKRGSVMLVGDISRKKGGSLAGHHSHQSGRDADIAFYAKNKKGKPVRLKKFVAFDGDGKAKDGSGLRFDTWRNWLLIQSWINDHRAGLSHIFVSRPLKKRLLAFARKRPAYKKHVKRALQLLKEPANADAHDDHFHVRISCPKKQDDICHEEPRKK